jgi:hypothetical protein
VQVEASFLGPDSIIGLAIARQGNQSDHRASRSPPNLPGNLIAIELRKTNVDQGDLRPGVKDKAETGSPICCHLDVMTVERQKCPEHLARIGMIFDHDDPAWARGTELAIWRGGHGRSREREADDELAPLTKTCAVCRNAAAMMFDETACHSESEPKSALAAMERSLNLSEQLENGLEHVRRQANAPILNAENGLAVLLTHKHSNRCPCRRVLDGIVQEVSDDLFQTDRIPIDDDRVSIRGQGYVMSTRCSRLA